MSRFPHSGGTSVSSAVFFFEYQVVWKETFEHRVSYFIGLMNLNLRRFDLLRISSCVLSFIASESCHAFLVAVAACGIQYDGVTSHFLLHFLYNDVPCLYHNVTTELVSSRISASTRGCYKCEIYFVECRVFHSSAAVRENCGTKKRFIGFASSSFCAPNHQCFLYAFFYIFPHLLPPQISLSFLS